MKPSEQPAQHTPAPRPLKLQSAGLYGEVAVLPLHRGPPAPYHEPKSFL